MRLLNEAKFVVTFLLVLILLFSGILYWILFLKKADSDSPTIGILTFKSKTVLRKFNDGVVWDQIETKSPVKNRDTIRTEKFSDATLTLNDGTQIKISENSMILLDISDKNININFAYGSFEAQREGSLTGESKLNIQSGNQKVSVGAGELKLDKTKSELNIQVGNGEAKVSSNGIENTVGKNETANLSGEGVQVTKSIFGLETPEDRRNYLTDKSSENILFTFSGMDAKNIRENKPILEVSSFPDFSKLIHSEILKGNSTKKSFPAGAYYFRVRYNEANKRLFTGVSRFRIINDPGLRIVSPKDGEVYPFQSVAPVVRISWNELELYTNFNVQIARDANFSGADVITKQTQNNSIAFDGLNEGDYFLRILAKSTVSGVADKFSATQKFSIRKRINLEPPELLEPQKNRSIPEEQLKAGLFFSWKDNREFNQFTLEVSKDKDFQSTILRENLKSNFFKYSKSLDLGTYYWKIIGTAPSGQTISSPIQSFTVIAKENLELLYPRDQMEVSINEEGIVLLKWKKLIQNPGYTIEVAKNESFSAIVASNELREPYYEFRTKDLGKFFWRVKANGNDPTVSEVRSFFVSSSMEPPVLLTPTKNESIDLFQKNSILFSWKPSEKAVAYRIRIVDVTGIREKMVVSERVTTPKYSFTDFPKLNMGRYRVEVASLYPSSNGDKESSYTRSDFFVVVPELKIPKILSPGTIYVE